jgi:hypothetical protein
MLKFKERNLEFKEIKCFTRDSHHISNRNGLVPQLILSAQRVWPDDTVASTGCGV